MKIGGTYIMTFAELIIFLIMLGVCKFVSWCVKEGEKQQRLEEF